MCSVTMDGRDLLASGGEDGTVRVWDPATGEPVATLHGHQDRVSEVCRVTVNGRDLLASSARYELRIWDPAGGTLLITIPVHYHALAICQVSTLLVAGLDAGLLAISLSPGL